MTDHEYEQFSEARRQLISTFEPMIIHDSPELFIKFLEFHNNPDKVIKIIDIIFEHHAFKCLAYLVDRLPNYDKYIAKMFNAKQELMPSPSLQKMEQQYLTLYENILKSKYAPKRKAND